MDALHARVRRLERINCGLVGLCMLACLMAAGQKIARFDEIKCRSLEIVNRRGESVITMDTNGVKDTPLFSISSNMVGKDGKLPGGLFFGYDERGDAILSVNDSHTKANVTIARWKDQVGVYIYDKDGKEVATFPK